MGPYGSWWWGMGFPWVFPFFFFIVAMALCALFMLRGGWWGGHRGREERGESALDILDRRFAQGEIDRAKYDEMRQALRH